MASIVNKTEKWVRMLLQEQLTNDHCYHNLAHTQAVVEAARLLGARHGINAIELENLEIAAWFHDTGFIHTYEDHEEEGKRLATEFLTKEGHPKERIEDIGRLIMATVISYTPIDQLEMIIRDADLSNLGRADYLAVLNGLRHEWEFFRNEIHKNRAWYKLNHAFVTNHQYHTDIARDIYGIQRQQNQKLLKRIIPKKETSC